MVDTFSGQVSADCSLAPERIEDTTAADMLEDLDEHLKPVGSAWSSRS
jgi:hypothetical protein